MFTLPFISALGCFHYATTQILSERLLSCIPVWCYLTIYLPPLNKKRQLALRHFGHYSCVEKIVICLCMFMFFIKSLFIQRKLMLFKAWQQNFHSTHIHASEH